jgi:hypothetical protein
MKGSIHRQHDVATHHAIGEDHRARCAQRATSPARPPSLAHRPGPAARRSVRPGGSQHDRVMVSPTGSLPASPNATRWMITSSRIRYDRPASRGGGRTMHREAAHRRFVASRARIDHDDAPGPQCVGADRFAPLRGAIRHSAQYGVIRSHQRRRLRRRTIDSPCSDASVPELSYRRPEERPRTSTALPRRESPNDRFG